MTGFRGIVGALLCSLVVAPLEAQNRVEPELVQPDVISGPRNETFPFVDPTDGSLWFSVYDDNFDRQTIMRAPRAGAAWGTPAKVSFSTGEWGDRAARFSPDGKRLFISSNRPTSAGGRAGLFHLWVLDRDGAAWSAPRHLPEPINSGAADRHSSQTSAGDLYFSSTRPGGPGRSDIYRVRATASGWGAAEVLPPPVNDPLGQTDLLVAPDGKWMILVITDHPQGLGGDDLFLLAREGDGWAAPRRLPEGINTKEYEYGPSLSPDGKTLYFTSHRRGSADVYRVPVAALGLPR